MEFLAALLGAGIVAASPFVPVLRPVAKAAVKGGLAVSEAAVGAATIVGQQVDSVVSKAKANAEGESAAGADPEASSQDQDVGTTTTVDEGQANGKAAGLGSLTAALRPATQSAVKAGVAVTEKAKGAVSAAGKQWSDLVTEAKESREATAADVEPAVGTVDEPPEPPAPDDLTAIRGIGPKSASILQTAGITTYAQLAAVDEAQLRQIMEDSGANFRLVNPEGWSEQARQMAEAA